MHFCLHCYWIAFNSVQKTPFLRWTVMMVEAGPWGCLFWREMTVASKLNIPLSFPFSGVYWRCLWPRWLGQLDSLDTEGVHPDCWVRAFCLATASPPPPPPPSPLPYPLEFARRMICENPLRNHPFWLAFSVNQITCTRVGREGRERDTWEDGMQNLPEHEIVVVKLTLL